MYPYQDSRQSLQKEEPSEKSVASVFLQALKQAIFKCEALDGSDSMIRLYSPLTQLNIPRIGMEITRKSTKDPKPYKLALLNIKIVFPRF